MDDRAPYPHCDDLVLHKPGDCQYCDHYPERQAERARSGVNFTGEHNPSMQPCPAEQRRELTTINRWYGNVAKPAPQVRRYRKRPIIISAVQFKPLAQPWPEGVHPWPAPDGLRPRDMSFGYIDTLEGRMSVQAGDYVIRGIKNELYPCKADIFEASYELVEEE